MANSWFLYDGSGDPCDPLNYTPVQMTNCPSPNQRLCSIFATVQIIGGVQRPSITPTLCLEITNAVANHTESANVLLRPN